MRGDKTDVALTIVGVVVILIGIGLNLWGMFR